MVNFPQLENFCTKFRYAYKIWYIFDILSCSKNDENSYWSAMEDIASNFQVCLKLARLFLLKYYTEWLLISLLLRLNQMLYALCLSYHPNTEAVLFSCLSSGWTTTMGGCLAPRWKIALKVSFPRTQRRATASGVEPNFRNLSITSGRWSGVELSHAAAFAC